MKHPRWIAPLLLGASCAGPRAVPPPPPAAPAEPARATGRPEIRYYEISDA